MDAEQKYIEEQTNPFEVDMQFIEQLKNYSLHHSLNIANQVDVNAPLLPEKDGWAQYVGGVVKFEEPIYISIEEIDVDDYLDYINLNQILSDERI